MPVGRLADPMFAAVLSTGTELTRGELVNTNAAWLSEELTALGFDVVEHCTVDDDVDRIGEAVLRLATKVDAIVSTGGLGPTTDDLTALAVAKALGVPLERDEASVEHMRRLFERIGREMQPVNEKQADLPAGSTVLSNGQGTAPGFAVDAGRARAFFLPGVPREMKAMFADHVSRELSARCARTTHQIHLRTLGLGESEIQARLADLEAAHEGVTLGYRATFPEVEVKVFARGPDEASAEVLARAAADDVRKRLGDAIYGDRDDTFPAAVGRALRARGLRLAIAESCTGGLMGAMLTEVPGSSEYLVADVVAYANSAKTRLLGVQPELLRAHGAVSVECARAMAEGALELADADLAIAITGIAGPLGGTEDRPVGTVCFGVAERGTEATGHVRKWPSRDRDRIRDLSVYHALRLVFDIARRR